MMQQPGIAAGTGFATRSNATIGKLRWWMIGLVALATTINYIDRQSISLLFPVMGRSDQLNLTPLQYSRVGSALLLAYMISQSVSGKFYDRYGNRLGFAVSIIIWSLAAMRSEEHTSELQ